jgi:hypothetical protein
MFSKIIFFLLSVLLMMVMEVGTKELSDCQKLCQKHFEDCDYQAKTRSQHKACEEKREKCGRECKKLDF